MRLLYGKETVQSCNRGYIVRLLYGKEAVQGVNIVCLSITIFCWPHLS